MDITTERIEKITKELTLIQEDLRALNDDIWHNLDHSSEEEVQAASSFQLKYIKLLSQFAQDAGEISSLLSEISPVKENSSVVAPSKDSANERLIKELNKEEPHSINEEFTYKRPYAIILENRAYKELETWKDVYMCICKHLARKNLELFNSLPSSDENYFSSKKEDLRVPEKITQKTYAELNLSANYIAKQIKKLLKAYNIQEDSLIVYLRQDRNA
jgi:hypothetical protein